MTLVSDLHAEVTDLLSRELQLCRTLREMISRELEAIVLDKDMDQLLRVLNQKDEVIGQLQLLTGAWEGLLEGAGLEDRPEGIGRRLVALFPGDPSLTGLLDAIHNAAEDISRAEGEALAELEKHAAHLREQIMARNKGRDAAARYVRQGRAFF